MKEIIDFIKRFKGSEDVFLHGCCYWFARILEERFAYKYCTQIIYAPIEGHFVTRIWNKNSPSKLYDIRGDVTAIYKDSVLDSLEDIRRYDETHYTHLMRDCRDFLEPVEQITNSLGIVPFSDSEEWVLRNNTSDILQFNPTFEW